MARPVKLGSITAFPRREAKAQVTRRRVLDAARSLFIERGYVTTTIGAIAERADVSPETIYATFGAKRAVLTEVVDISIAGGTTAIPILDQDWVRAMRDEADPGRRARSLAAAGRAILERRADLDEVVRNAAAADPEMAVLRDRLKADRRKGQRELLKIVVGSASLRPDLDLETAADILYACGSPETYRLLVADRGWTAEQFERWYGDLLEGLLTPKDNRHGSRSSART